MNVLIENDEERSDVIGFSPKISHQTEEVALIYQGFGHLEEWMKAKQKASRVTGSVASTVGFQDEKILVRRFGLFVLAPIPQETVTIEALEQALQSGLEAGIDPSDIVLTDRSTKSLLGAVMRELPQPQVWVID